MNNNLVFIANSIIEDIRLFQKVINGQYIANTKNLYDALYENKDIFELLVEESIKKASIEDATSFYDDIYEYIIPYLRDTLLIDGIYFEKTEIDNNHKILLNVYIEDTWYGTLDVFNRTYEYPNESRMREIEKEAINIQTDINKIEEKMIPIAVRIKEPKKFFKEDRTFHAKYLLNKKNTIKQLQDEFIILDNERTVKNQQLAELNSEYSEYQLLIGGNRYYDEKLNERLKDRLNIELTENNKEDDKE